MPDRACSRDEQEAKSAQFRAHGVEHIGMDGSAKPAKAGRVQS